MADCYKEDYTSNAIIDKKVFTVNAGIDSDKIKEVVDIVLEELEKYRNNCIEDGEKLFNMAKECILNDMMQVYDTQGALLLRRLKDSIGNAYKYDDLMKCIYEVKIEDVIECSKLIYLDTVYVLKGER
jgi:predicted Zn-dependent peptidase